MLLQDKSRQSRQIRITRFAIGAVVVLLGTFLLLRYFIPFYGFAKKGVVVCDAENVRGGSFVSRGYTFKNGETQSAERSYSGSYSSKVSRTQPKGMLYKLRNANPGDRYKVSVWRYRLGTQGGELVVLGEGGLNLEKRENIAVSKNNDGWEKLEVSFNVPAFQKIGPISIYVFSNTVSPIFFDDLTIQKLNVSKDGNALMVKPYNPKTLKLEVGQVLMNNIRTKREEAFRNGFLEVGDLDWVNAKINEETQRLDAELRLKGHQLYHIQGEKWSFRVKVKDPYSWNGLKSFSLQNPAYKSYLNEWLFHQFLRKEDVLATRYDFVRLQLNNGDLGIYGYEEHLDKQLMESQQRKPGVIVKFSDDAHWLNLKTQLELLGQREDDTQFINAFDAATVEVYKDNKIITTDNVSLIEQFAIAERLMVDFQKNQQAPSEIFEIDLVAKYYAIMDVLQAYNSIDWQDMRFYYNPYSSKLEPIGTSGFGAEITPYKKRPFIGYHIFNKNVNEYGLHANFFLDRQFVELYCQYLYQFSSKKYIDALLLDLEDQLVSREQFIKKEFPAYAFDTDAIKSRARKLQATIMPKNNQSVVARIEGEQGNNMTLQVSNFHSLPLQVVGFSNISTEVRDTMRVNQLLEINLSDGLPTYQKMTAKSDIAYIFYKLPGLDSLFRSEISPWNTPVEAVPSHELFRNVNLQSNAYFQVIGRLIVFKKGEYTINQDIIIPEGYTVRFDAGTTINFIKGARFISKSPVQMMGRPEDMIKIRSGDKTAGGFTVLDAESPSMVQNVIFKELNHFKYKKWAIPGSVTFYNTDVTIDDCTFMSSQSREGLHLVRSNFTINGTNFNQNIGTALTTLFSEGQLNSVDINNSGLDGVRFYNSKITLRDVEVLNTSNTAISVSENSRVKASQLKVRQANIGIASMDLSKISVDFIDISNCEFGFSAYQRLPEYGGGEIVIDNYNVREVSSLHKIEFNSRLNLKGNEIKVF